MIFIFTFIFIFISLPSWVLLNGDLIYLKISASSVHTINSYNYYARVYFLLCNSIIYLKTTNYNEKFPSI